jgi:hypothetical protein
LKDSTLRSFKVWACIAAVVALYCIGLGLRRSVLRAQYENVGRDLPFTLESALHADRIQTIYDSGSLPKLNRELEYPHGVENWKTYTIGSEYVYAALCRVLPSSIPLRERIRWTESAWFCLGIPLIALWIGLWWRSIAGALFAGAFYALPLASVIRSTGQEVSRENFALPILLCHLALDTAASKAKGRTAFLACAIGSGVSLGLAMMSWDLIQYYAALWIVYSGVRLMRAELRGGTREATLWRTQFICLAGASLLHPYLFSHRLIFSPVMLAGMGIFLGTFLVTSVSSGWKRRLSAGGVVILVALGGWFAAGAFSEHYGHFGELLAAKIVHLNQKPADPALLTFNQRIMWVPALHSANKELTFELFPANLMLALIAGLVLLTQPRFRSDSRFVQLLFFCALSVGTFYLFVRFHVFLAVFLAALLGCSAAWGSTFEKWQQVALMIMLSAGIVFEAGHVISAPEQWGRTGFYYREQDELVKWLEENVAPEPVLASFGTSAAVASRAGCPVLLHPKFETPRIRERVRHYGEHLFKGTEKSFRDWADGEGAAYYVYGIGEFYPSGIPYQMRYFVDAVEPPESAPALAFENNRPLEYFQPKWENRKYRVYRIRTAADEAEARTAGFMANRALQRGDLDAAETLAMEALTLNPSNREALDILNKVTRLREAGFSYQMENGEDGPR